MLTARERHSALIEAMIADGTLTDAALIDAFRSVPRHAFIPEAGALTSQGAALNAAGNPERWLAAVYSDNAVATRVQGSGPSRRPDPAPSQGMPAPRAPEHDADSATSCSSAPTVLARLLDLADLTPGQEVLEIGTGTGWNTALLAHLLGDDAVTSVEIDPRLAEAARRSLRAWRHVPAVHVADGYEGYPPRAPYDRIVSTCGVRRMPPAWLEQLRPNGSVVCPWGLLEGAGVLTRVRVPPAGVALGRFHAGVGFVPLDVPGTPAPPVRDSGQQPDEYRLVQTDPVAPLMSFPSAFALSVMVADWRVRRRWIGTGSGMWVCDHAGTSWVRVYPYGTSWMIEQGGPRSIWDEFEDALEEWSRLGEPAPDRFGLAVEPDGSHRVWLDEPEHRSWAV